MGPFVSAQSSRRTLRCEIATEGDVRSLLRPSACIWFLSEVAEFMVDSERISVCSLLIEFRFVPFPLPPPSRTSSSWSKEARFRKNRCLRAPSALGLRVGVKDSNDRSTSSASTLKLLCMASPGNRGFASPRYFAEATAKLFAGAERLNLSEGSSVRAAAAAGPRTVRNVASASCESFESGRPTFEEANVKPPRPPLSLIRLLPAPTRPLPPLPPECK